MFVVQGVEFVVDFVVASELSSVAEYGSCIALSWPETESDRKDKTMSR